MQRRPVRRAPVGRACQEISVKDSKLTWQQAECPYCNYMNSPGTKFCPSCGCRMPHSRLRRIAWCYLIVLIALVAVS